METIIAIDPGREKCGAAILAEDGSFTQEVIETECLCRWVARSVAKALMRPLLSATGQEAEQRTTA